MIREQIYLHGIKMLVEEVLKTKKVQYRSQGKDFVIRCLNPEHPDNNPSTRVDKTTGMFHCFSCNYKGNIFTHFKILNNTVSIRVAKLKDKLLTLMTNAKTLTMPELYNPFNKNYRGISANTYIKFGAFTTYSIEELKDRICFPIRNSSNDIVAFIGRHLLSDSNPRYKNYPKGAQIPIVPAKLEKSSKSLVIVEGIFDVLNLYDKGLTNVVAAMGTSTISKDNCAAKFMTFKAQGVEKIYILFDGDEAGRKAAQSLKPILEDNMFNVEILELQDDSDPGELSESEVRSLNAYINEETYSDN